MEDLVKNEESITSFLNCITLINEILRRFKFEHSFLYQSK